MCQPREARRRPSVVEHVASVVDAGSCGLRRDDHFLVESDLALHIAVRLRRRRVVRRHVS